MHAQMCVTTESGFTLVGTVPMRAPDTSTEQHEQMMTCKKAYHLFAWPVEIGFGVDE